MKKIFIAFFGIILFVSLSACKSKKHEIILVQDEKIETLAEKSMLEDIREDKELSFDFKNVKVSNQEGLNDYLKEFSNSKDKSNKTFIISEALNTISDEFKDYNIVYVNKNGENNRTINIDQTHISYLYGIISGMLTRTNEVSVIYSKDILDSSKNMFAFISGVKNVNLRAYDYLSVGKNIFDVSEINGDEREAAIENFIKNNKSDVIFYLNHTFNENISNIFEQSSKLIFTLNEHSDPYVKVTYAYEDILQNIVNNDQKLNIVSFLNDTISMDISNLPEEVQNILGEYIQSIKSNGITFPNSFEELKGKKQ